MRKQYRTDIEEKMEEALAKAGIQVEFQYSYRSKYGYVMDFAIPELKICIECDGEHWHNSKKDNKRDGVMRNNGWAILRFPGKQIMSDVDSCTNQISSLIERRQKVNGNI